MHIKDRADNIIRRTSKTIWFHVPCRDRSINGMYVSMSWRGGNIVTVIITNKFVDNVCSRAFPTIQRAFYSFSFHVTWFETGRMKATQKLNLMSTHIILFQSFTADTSLCFTMEFSWRSFCVLGAANMNDLLSGKRIGD